MEKYKAKKNNSAKKPEKKVAQQQDAGNSGGGEEAEVPKSQDEKNIENNENTLKNVAEVAEATGNPYAVAAAKAFKAADKISGGKSTQMLAKGMNTANKIAPGGKQIQDASNKLSESGVGDKIGQAASMKNGGGGTGGGGGSASGGAGAGGKKTGVYVAIVAAIALFFLLVITVILGDGEIMMGVTNNETLTFTANGTRTCTEEEVENKLIYVGDKRVSSINDSLMNYKITYITYDTGNLNWLNNLGISQLESKLIENPNQVVVISLGLNDLGNIDGYIESYKNLINKYPNQVYISSINPVDESKTSSYTNIDIENFNKQISDNFPNNYIDTYSMIGTINTSDGIYYEDDINNIIHSNIVSNLKNSGKVMCSTGLSNIVYYNQNDYTQSYGHGTTIKSDGCGPVAMAMILSTLKGSAITPVETADYSLEHGYKTDAGTSVDFFPAISDHYGIKCETISLDKDSIVNNLSQSKPIIMLVGPGIFTSRNHYIVLTGVSSDGKISIADSLSLEKSNQLWDINTLIDEGTGSLWAFSN